MEVWGKPPREPVPRGREGNSGGPSGDPSREAVLGGFQEAPRVFSSWVGARDCGRGSFISIITCGGVEGRVWVEEEGERLLVEEDGERLLVEEEGERLLEEDC